VERIPYFRHLSVDPFLLCIPIHFLVPFPLKLTPPPPPPPFISSQLLYPLRVISSCLPTCAPDNMFEEYLQPWPWALLFVNFFQVGYTERVFSANFGVSSLICSRLWRILRPRQHEVQPMHLFYFLAFIKTYDTFDSLSTKFHVTEKTFRSNAWKVARILNDRLNKVWFRHFCCPFSAFLSSSF